MLCTERLSADWTALLHAFHAKNATSIGHITHKGSEGEHEELSADNAAYVRHLYHADALLYERMCRGS